MDGQRCPLQCRGGQGGGPWGAVSGGFGAHQMCPWLTDPFLPFLQGSPGKTGPKGSTVSIPACWDGELRAGQGLSPVFSTHPRGGDTHRPPTALTVPCSAQAGLELQDGFVPMHSISHCVDLVGVQGTADATCQPRGHPLPAQPK